ncbi:UNVERIFIED_CONTAM: hypothetical protein K2H54_058226 [Gekko kuhli]
MISRFLLKKGDDWGEEHLKLGNACLHQGVWQPHPEATSSHNDVRVMLWYLGKNSEVNLASTKIEGMYFTQGGGSNSEREGNTVASLAPQHNGEPDSCTWKCIGSVGPG